MCIGCYEEYGSPDVINDRVLRAVKLVGDVYSLYPAGGDGHIVFDDWNLEDDNVDWCIKNAGAGIALEALVAFKNMSIEERASALAIRDGFIGY